METNITSEALPDSLGVIEAASQEPVTAVNPDNKGEATPSLTEILSETFGRKFANQEEALKAVEETKNYVGKAQDYATHVKELSTSKGISKAEARKLMDNVITEPVETVKETPQVTPESNDAVETLQREIADIKFFKSNPNLEKHEDLLKEIRGTSGKSYEAILETDTFKSVFDKVEAHDEMETKKSVLSSKSRLGKATDNMSEATKAQKEGNNVKASKLAVDAVLEAYGDRS